MGHGLDALAWATLYRLVPDQSADGPRFFPEAFQPRVADFTGMKDNVSREDSQ
jgi:hypothetical protein